MAARAARVPPEPNEKEPGVMINVKHPILRGVKRKFDQLDKIKSVYDWVGSLAKEPKFFSLCISPAGEALLPSNLVTVAEDITLHVRQQDEPVTLSEDDNEVTFFGFGPIDASSANKTLIDNGTTPHDLAVQDVPTLLPNQIMVDDDRCA